MLHGIKHRLWVHVWRWNGGLDMCLMWKSGSYPGSARGRNHTGRCLRRRGRFSDFSKRMTQMLLLCRWTDLIDASFRWPLMYMIWRISTPGAYILLSWGAYWCFSPPCQSFSLVLWKRDTYSTPMSSCRKRKDSGVNCWWNSNPLDTCTKWTDKLNQTR